MDVSVLNPTISLFLCYFGRSDRYYLLVIREPSWNYFQYFVPSRVFMRSPFDEILGTFEMNFSKQIFFFIKLFHIEI